MDPSKMKLSRRDATKCALAISGGAILASILPYASPAFAISPRAGKRAERWINRAKKAVESRTERAEGLLFLGRFLDPVYFLTAPIAWHPNVAQGRSLGPVFVPAGFVTDFASIPRVFWSLLRPDGSYAHAAVIHDYLYWTQIVQRDLADEILKSDMQDLGVSPVTVEAIYRAVRVFGQSAWDENFRLKTNGERRLLKRYPSEPTIRWKDWKVQSDVFA